MQKFGAFIMVLILWSSQAMAFEPAPVDWNHGLQRIELNSTSPPDTSPVQKVSALGVSGSRIGIGFGPKGTPVSHVIDLAYGVMRQVRADEIASFNPLPLASGTIRVVLEPDNKVVLYDRGVAYTIPEGGLYKPPTIGIANGRFIVIPWFSNSIAVYETNGGYLGSLTGFNDDGIALLAGDEDLIAAATFSGKVFLWDIKPLRTIADYRTVRVGIRGAAEGSPAQKAGIKQYGVCLESVNGVPVKSIADAILTLKKSGTMKIVLNDCFKHPEQEVTVTKDEGPFGLNVVLKASSHKETLTPLAAVAFGRDNHWLAWSGNWRNFEVPFETWKLKPEDIEKMSPENRELLANQHSTGIADLRRQGDPELAKLLTVVRGKGNNSAVKATEDTTLLQTVWRKAFATNSPLHDRLSDRFLPRKESSIKDKVSGLSWFWNPIWFGGPLSEVEREVYGSGYRLATKGEVLELAHYIRDCRRRNEVYYADEPARKTLQSIDFINMEVPLWTSSRATDGRRYVCSIERLFCVPEEPKNAYGVGMVRESRGR